MKSFSAPLILEMTRSTARLATCIRIQRSDGNVYGFTTNRKVLTIGGLDYYPLASFIPSDLAAGSQMDTDNQSVDALLSIAGLTEDDLRAGRWDYATYRRFQVNWAGLSAGDKKDSKGHLGKVTVNRLTFAADLLGLMEAYATIVGDITQDMCRNDLGDTKCGVSLVGSPNRTFTGTIATSGTDYFTLTDPARTEADAFFDEGTLTLHFSTGDLRYEVKAYIQAGGTWVTKTPYAYDATGVAYTMTQGCRRRFVEDCVATFSNGARFNGEPWLRGNDALVQIGRHQ